MERRRREGGQAAVELVGVLPLVALLAAVVWQGIVAGQAIWLSGTAARAAARAQAAGTDPARAARATLPDHLRRDLSVRGEGGGVRVRVGIPVVVGGARLGTASARAYLRPQDG